jgi:phenylalanyl-tRNA synthetase beta chain
MRIPFSWLREYVVWDGTVEELAQVLTMSGTEVEAIDWVGAPRDPENLSRFVVGRVLTCGRHPNADKLSLCAVDVGEANGGVRQIVCGADNFDAGAVVAVSLSGAVLENGLRLKKANIRGVESDGMMMSEQELGYEEKSPGIAVLPDDWTVGAPLQDYLPVAEPVLELELTSNRPDCFSIYGIAREVAAAARAELAPPPIAGPAATGGAAAAETVAVEIADPDLCARYGARVIRGVRVGESPVWLKARLTHAGMRPINNVVDVTNYVMLAYGQPLHAFDLAKIEGAKLVVRRARPGERIVTLDGIERTLDAEMLVIADARRPLVIAGVFGSVDAEVDEHTTDLVLEAANFSGPSILRTEMHTGIRSEASNRFEKGLDPGLVPGGLDFACRLFRELCDGVVAPDVIDVGGAPPSPAPLRYRPAKADALLGYEIPPQEQAGILRRLECAVDSGAGDTGVLDTGTGDTGMVAARAVDTGASGAGALAVRPGRRLSSSAQWTVVPPIFRPDLTREVDLIEEVGRIAGYARAPETLPRHATSGGLTAAQRVRRAMRRALVGHGLDEAITYSFIAPDALAPLGLPEGDVRLAPVVLSNPMSVEQSVMRTMLLPGLLRAVHDNVDRLNDPPNLFEIGRVYLWDEPVVAPSHAAEAGAMLPHEPEALAIVLSGPLLPESWTGTRRPTDFYTLKGVVEAALGTLGLHAHFAPLGEAVSTFPYLHPGKSALVGVGPRTGVGVLGMLRPDVAVAYGLEDLTLYVASLDVDLLAEVALPVPVFEDLGAYPPAGQDLAVVVGCDVPAVDVIALARKAGGRLVRDAHVFDVYEGDQVPDGMRSLAVRLVMRAPDRTLSEKDINGVRRKVLDALERDLGATLR